MDNRIDELIEKVKRSQAEETKEERERQEALQQKKARAVRVVAEEAAKRFDLEKDEDARQQIERRLKYAEKARVSKAQAYADLAEQGDFESEPWWWDIREESEGQKISLWKGYVKYNRVIRRKLRTPDDFVDLNVREMVKGGFVAEVVGNYGVSVGIAEVQPVQAIRSAWSAYRQKSTGETVSTLPPELEFDDNEINHRGLEETVSAS